MFCVSLDVFYIQRPTGHPRHRACSSYFVSKIRYLKCLVRYLLQQKNRVKNHAKIHQNDSQIGPRGSRRGCWEHLGRPLGGSGGQLGPKMVSRPQKWKFWPPLGGHLGGQNRSKIDFKAILKVIFFYMFMDRFLTPFGANMRPSWANLRPTWGQLEPTWGQLETNLSQLEANLSQLEAT